MLRGFVIGAVASPFLLLALAYGSAFWGWTLAILGLLAAIVLIAASRSAVDTRDLPGSTDALRTDAAPPAHRIYRVDSSPLPPRRRPRQRGR